MFRARRSSFLQSPLQHQRAQSGFALVELAVAATLLMAIAFGFAAICLIGTTKLWLLRVGRETAACIASIDPKTARATEPQRCRDRAYQTFHIWLPRSLVKFHSHLSHRQSNPVVSVQARVHWPSAPSEVGAVTLRASFAVPKSGQAP